MTTETPATRPYVAWLRTQGVPTFVDEPRGKVAPLRHPVAFLLTFLTLAVLTVISSVIAAYGDVIREPGVVAALLVVAVALAWVIVSAQLIPITMFSLRWFLQALVRSNSSILHVIPLLLVAVTFFFLTAETWQSIGNLQGAPLILSMLLLATIAVTFIARRGIADADELSEFHDTADLVEQVPPALRDGVPAGVGPARQELRLAERVNVLFLSVIGKVIAAAIVSLVITVFFILLGTIAITGDVANAWTTAEPMVWWSARIGEHTYTLTAAHARVAAFLGVFAGLYFVVSSASDRDLAQSLSSDTDRHLRTCFAVRAAYRSLAETDADRPA